MAIEQIIREGVEEAFRRHAELRIELADMVASVSELLDISEDDALGVLNEGVTVQQALDRFGIEVIGCEMKEDECEGT